MIRRPPRSTRTDTLFPYTTLFRSAAARRLNRAVSVISYGIANLEAQLSLQLFDREGTRKPKLTTAGRAVLAEARAVSTGIDGRGAEVKGRLEGREGEGAHAVEVLFAER